MCGICGLIELEPRRLMPEATTAMVESLAHRGPDDRGTYHAPHATLGSTRLAILDLSAQGHMPMSTADGRYWIVHNGEVYNFMQLRKEMEAAGVQFHSNTDTEVILQLYAREGPAMLDRLNGMFAFAIWDVQAESLFAARDRMGVKPFYYAVDGERFYFASEEKAILAAGLTAEFDQDTWMELLLFRYVAGERTPFRKIKRLLPGHYLTVRDGRVQTRCWWSIDRIVDPDVGRKQSSAHAAYFRQLIEDSVALRRISDVPVGVLLSGGIDSSTVAAVMAQQAGSGVESFTVRFEDPYYDEGAVAQSVIDRWDLKGHSLIVEPGEIPSLLEDAAYYLDEPIVHGSDLHILAIARFARPKVTVLLSGEGADELLGGYVRYQLFKNSRWMQPIRLAAKILWPLAGLNGRMNKALEISSIDSPVLRRCFCSAEVFPGTLGIQAIDPEWFPYRVQLSEQAAKVYPEAVRQVMFYEQQTYLQSVLDRNDRMTMGASIECRVPFLDFRIVEMAANLPTAKMFEQGHSKAILRKAFSTDLPNEVLNHRKWGFGVPWNRYFREIPMLKRWVQHMPETNLMQSAPIPLGRMRQMIGEFMAGDDRRSWIVRQLFHISLWQRVMIEGQRQALQEYA